ncbi:unnamed protein product [Soboliphyme baturini]|uniref:Coatomer subunit gamma n=1 Tax=Soboliphyme baturini TaxID=241478 RepID=A0A183IMF7_9BILA|nr:unnamed protein product [Soboliphyme baturini]
MLKRDKKDEESSSVGANPYQNCDKTMVIQEARIFNETPINSRKSCLILTKLLYLIYQGEQLSRSEATEVFFSVTKLWQSKDVILRRLVYLTIKELAPIADDVIIVTSSLTKDMTGKEDMYRAAAVRTLCRITDVSMLQSIERYMKQAIVDKSPAVASAALVSSLHLLRRNTDAVKRWINEVQEAVNSDNLMVQYHGLALLYQIRKQDRLAVTKLVQKYCKQGLKSPFAVCYLIRLAASLIEDNRAENLVLFDFLENCLRHKYEMVVFEAACAIASLPDITSKELSCAISVLQLFCSSSKATMRFAAVSTLSKIAVAHPAAVATCNVDLEQLITDQNRSIATLAITTLLKTGAESSVDRLMKQISSFVSEISDEFKIVVIDAIRSLCVRYPRKHGTMMTFLSTMLRDEGGFEYKKALVDTIITIIENNPEAKETGLAHLCEFIEDCEHVVLATKILYLLGTEGPKCSFPRKYIRFIFNRVLLEGPAVRAAAVTALAKFGAYCNDLLSDIVILLQRCLLDPDDEVRDRATYYLSMLSEENPQFNTDYIINGLCVSFPVLEKGLEDYCENPHEKPFDLRSIPLVPLAQRTAAERLPSANREAAPAKKPEKPLVSRHELYAQQLKAIPELDKLGVLLKSSEPVGLTELEVEISVTCVKHMFAKHVVFQNTLSDQLLQDVVVHMEPASEEWTVVTQIKCDQLPCNVPGSAYTVVMFPADSTDIVGTFSCVLKYTVKDTEADSGTGYPDEFVLEDVDVTVSDHIIALPCPDFNGLWTKLSSENELSDTYALASVKTLEGTTYRDLTLLFAA